MSSLSTNMLPSITNDVETKTKSIKFLVRTALAFGVLSAAAEAQINRLVIKGTLSNQDWLLMSALRDAIKEGRVNRENTPSYTN